MPFNHFSMFNFGLLSTHLPYLVFVAAYVFYFITSAGNETMVADVVQSPEKVIVQNNIEAFVQNVDKQVAYYDAFYISVDDGVSSGCLQNNLIRNFIRVMPDDKINSRNFSFALFSRPPPIIG